MTNHQKSKGKTKKPDKRYQTKYRQWRTKWQAHGVLFLQQGLELRLNQWRVRQGSLDWDAAIDAGTDLLIEWGYGVDVMEWFTVPQES